MFQLLPSSYCVNGVNVCLGMLEKPPLNHKETNELAWINSIFSFVLDAWKPSRKHD